MEFLDDAVGLGRGDRRSALFDVVELQEKLVSFFVGPAAGTGQISGTECLSARRTAMAMGRHRERRRHRDPKRVCRSTVRAGRRPESLGCGFEPPAQAIRTRVKQADADERLRSDGRTTERGAGAKPASDVVHRDFPTDGPHRLWVANITYVPASAGWLPRGRRGGPEPSGRGLAGGRQMPTQPVRDAPTMALTPCRPKHGLVDHSDSERMGAGSLCRIGPNDGSLFHVDGPLPQMGDKRSGPSWQIAMPPGGGVHSIGNRTREIA